jgi:hypothetical protein
VSIQKQSTLKIGNTKTTCPIHSFVSLYALQLSDRRSWERAGVREKLESYTDKKENQIFRIYKEIQNGSVAKSYMTNGYLIYEEIFAHFLILGSPSSYMTLQLLHSEFPYI